MTRVHAPTVPSFRLHVAAALGRWATGARRPHNLHALCYVATVAAVAIGATWTAADRTIALRLIMVVLFASHLLAHRLVVRVLTLLRDRGMREARRTLDVYLGSGQINLVEIAVIWIGIGLFAPLLDLVAPAVAG
ncbi:MAG: hypothetical protein JO128_16970 [Alphaproteobacteria bacterium]|nr:hypothetical protein [Alphaproteobacteria bacterium]